MSTTNAKHTPGELALEYINRADAPYDPAGPAIADLHGLQSALARVTAQRDQCREALDDALPLLIRLGDFIANGEDASRGCMERCDAILRVRAALASVRSEGGVL